MSQPTVQPPPTTRVHEVLQSQRLQEAPRIHPGEVEVKGPGGRLSTGPGFASLRDDRAVRHNLDAETYSYGFAKDGRYIGCNPEQPYPFKTKHYHEPIPAAVDWFRHQTVGDAKHTRFEDTEECKAEIAEYFTAENDDGYNQWMARKEKEKLLLAEKQKEIYTVPSEVKNLPGHAGPPILETSNEEYGRFNDLLPAPPMIYPLRTKVQHPPMKVLVKFRPSNMSDHPPIPDHSFAVDPREMMTAEGCYTRGIHGAVHFPEIGGSRSSHCTFQTSAMLLGEKIGERRTGYTLPLLAPSGLEVNRSVSSRCVSVLKSSPTNPSRHEQIYVPSQTVPRIYNRYVRYSSYPGGDKETEPNPAKKPVRVVCAPYTPYPPANPKLNPCAQLKNPSTLPIPLGLQH